MPIRPVAVSLPEVARFWLSTALLVAGLFLVTVTLVYLAIVARRRSPLRADVLRRVEAKRRLPSGRPARFLYAYLAGLLLLDNGVQATALYRASRALARRRLRLLAEFVHAFAKALTNIDVSPYAEVGGGLQFFHGNGAVIGKRSTLGERVTVCQGVTIGAGRPVVGDDVILWAGAKVVGDVRIGDGAEVGANAVVTRDVPPGCVAVGVPATRFLPKSRPAGDPVQDD